MLICVKKYTFPAVCWQKIIHFWKPPGEKSHSLGPGKTGPAAPDEVQDEGQGDPSPTAAASYSLKIFPTRGLTARVMILHHFQAPRNNNDKS